MTFFSVLQIKFECRQFTSIFEGVMPLLELRMLQIHSFPQFSPTCFDILSWNFTYDFVSLYYRSSSSVLTLRQFLKELCLFLNLEYRKYSFPQFSPTCFDILSWSFDDEYVLMYYRSNSCVVNLRQFCGSYAPFGTQNTENTQFSTLFSYMLWGIELKFCIWLCFTVIQIKFECRQFASIFVGVVSLLGLRLLEVQFSALFSFIHALTY